MKKQEKGISVKEEKNLISKLPSWIPEKIDTADAMFQTGQQLLLLVEQILTKYYGFSEKEIKEMELHIKDGLTTLTDLERNGLSILSPNDMATLGEIVEIRKHRLSAGRAGIALPNAQEMEKIRKLKGGKQ